MKKCKCLSSFNTHRVVCKLFARVHPLSAPARVVLTLCLMRSASTSRLVFILTALELQVFSEQTRSVIAVVCFCESPIQLLAVPIVRITVPICEFVVAHAYDPRLSVLFRDLARGVRRCLSKVFAGERVSLSHTCTTSLILSVCGDKLH